MGKNARRISADILYNVYKNGAYLNEELKALRKSGDFCNNDIRFVNELVMGVLKNKLRIDYIISKNINIRLKKVSTYILAILECGVYQIMFMDKVPHSAAVNEAVKLTKTKKLQRSSGFVNAVMRSILKNKDSIEYPKDKTEYLSIYYSFPKWLVEKWVNDFGFERASSIIHGLSGKADLYFRVNTLKTDANSLKESLKNSGCEVSVYKNPDFPSLDCMLLCKGVSDIENLDEYKNGLFYVQDFAACLTVEILDVKEGMTVADMCAAPGGKTTHIAEKMNNKGKIYAFDMYEHKINKINENAKRLGIDIIDAKVCDSSVNIKELNGVCDRVLVDAPCSGLGIIRRKPDIKYSRTSDDSIELSKISYAILDNAKNYLKSGGIMVFSTCTIEQIENDDVVNEFLKNNNNFKKQVIRCNKDNDGSITLYPDTDNCDGFYMCKLLKVED